MFKYASPCSDYYTENDTKKILELNGVNLSRASQDKGKVNTLGYQLIEFCRSNSMIILNGRIGLDKCVGRTTSKDCSLVDYIISSPA